MMVFDGIAYFLNIERFKPYSLLIHAKYDKGECFSASGQRLTLCWGVLGRRVHRLHSRPARAALCAQFGIATS